MVVKPARFGFFPNTISHGDLPFRSITGVLFSRQKRGQQTQARGTPEDLTQRESLANEQVSSPRSSGSAIWFLCCNRGSFNKNAISMSPVIEFFSKTSFRIKADVSNLITPGFH